MASQKDDVSKAETAGGVEQTIQACDEATPPPVLCGLSTEQDRLSQGQAGEIGSHSVLVEVRRSCRKKTD